ncbi:hypothetical protein SSQ_01307 [Enterococcus faecium EnGen0193]|uniref:DUF2188 domain-containing protein n=1 Tax=Enterococcus faecium TaxID=1352 RepID=UPI000330ADDE|nr:DUF2188 domain-containing protein [Enterococcus faecium]EOM20499.1 hypothetical protein SSQ_01307 [Enterococcus faecium EnGen0193]
MGKNQHVVPNSNGGWNVKGAGNSKATAHTNTKSEAVKIAREISKNQGSELFIHGRDGKIKSRDSHGNDPHPPKG